MAFIGVSLIVVSVTYIICWKGAFLWPRVASYFINREQRTIEAPSIVIEKGYQDGLAISTTLNGSARTAIAEDPEARMDFTVHEKLSQPAQTKNATVTGLNEPSASQLMPPPPRPIPRTTSASSPQRSILQPPSRGPLPNRSPPGAGGAKTLLSTLTSSTQPPSKSRKVILAPGHSPLDWAALTNSGSNLAGVAFPQRISRSQLAQQTGRKGKPAWAAWQGKVYNIGPYLPFHPGGAGELMRAAGKMPEVSEKLFAEVHPWVNWEGMLAACLVGFLVSDAEEKESSTLESLD